MLILGPKMSHFPYFGLRKNSHQKIGSVTLICLLNPNLMVKIRKKVIKRSRKSDVIDAQKGRLAEERNS